MEPGSREAPARAVLESAELVEHVKQRGGVLSIAVQDMLVG